MSGHSKWSQIKRQKGVADQRRGKIFTKIGREIQMAARAGGADPALNPALRLAIAKARQANMPRDNIDRAIKRATEGTGGEDWQQVLYEGYGPGGAALLIDTLTDNRNRSVSEIRATLSRGGGNMGEAGSTAWIFVLKGQIAVETGGVDADRVALQAIDAGAEDVQLDEGGIEVITAPADFESVRDALESAGVPIASAEVAMWPSSTVPLDEEKARTLLRLVEHLEDLDDVQRVYTNADIPDAVLVEA